MHVLAEKGGAQLLNSADPACPQLGTHLVACGKALLEYYAICAREDRIMTPIAIAHLGHTTRACVKAWGDSGQPVTMKWHAFGAHFEAQSAFSGNPSYSHNYADESENYSSRVRGFGLYRPMFAVTWLTKWVTEFFMHNNIDTNE